MSIYVWSTPQTHAKVDFKTILTKVYSLLTNWDNNQNKKKFNKIISEHQKNKWVNEDESIIKTSRACSLSLLCLSQIDSIFS